MGVTSLINQGVSPNAFKPAQNPERDTYAPTYEIKHRPGPGGKVTFFADEFRKYIDSIEFEDNLDIMDEFTLTFKNPPELIQDSNLLAEGSILELETGYGKKVSSIGAAVIVKRQPEFSDEGIFYRIVCYGNMFRAARNSPAGGISYKGKTTTEIVKAIGMRNGFNVDAVDALGKPAIDIIPGEFVGGPQKQGLNDLRYLKKVASITGREVFSKFDSKTGKFNLFFRTPPTENNKEVFTFVYNDDTVGYETRLLSFSPNKDAFDQGTDFDIFLIGDGGSRVNFPFIDQLTLKNQAKIVKSIKFGSFGTDNTIDPNFDGLQVAFKAFGQSFRFPPNIRFRNASQAITAIKQFIQRQRENFITGEGVLVGNEFVQARQIHKLIGLTKEFNGKYYFTKVEHTIDTKSEGYRTEFFCRKVIKDFFVLSPPTLNITANGVTIKQFKGLESSSAGQSFQFIDQLPQGDEDTELQ